MTKESKNPRRYSRGAALLDPAQPLSVYFAIQVDDVRLASTVGLIEYLKEQHPDALVKVVGYHREHKEIVLTLEINAQEARLALRGQSPALNAGYNFLWDVWTTLFYANPALCSAPNDSEREDVNKIVALSSII
jgi:hypothetical protein